MSILLSVLKTAILITNLLLALSFKNTVNLKSASFVVIMFLHKGLTHIHSQKKPKLQFGESFTINSSGVPCVSAHNVIFGNHKPLNI